MNQSPEVLQILDGRHERFLSRHQQMVLAGLWLAMDTAQMAQTFSCSEPTIIRTRRKTMEAVFDFTELAGTPELLRLWGERHWGCCTDVSLEMIENSQLLIGW